MTDVTHLRLLWADGDILHGRYELAFGAVDFRSPTTGRRA